MIESRRGQTAQPPDTRTPTEDHTTEPEVNNDPRDTR